MGKRHDKHVAEQIALAQAYFCMLEDRHRFPVSLQDSVTNMYKDVKVDSHRGERTVIQLMPSHYVEKRLRATYTSRNISYLSVRRFKTGVEKEQHALSEISGRFFLFSDSGVARTAEELDTFMKNFDDAWEAALKALDTW